MDIRFHENLTDTVLLDAGFTGTELPYGLVAGCTAQDVRKKTGAVEVSGLSVSGKDLTADTLKSVITLAADLDASYIVIETLEIRERDSLKSVIATAVQEIKQAAIPIYIENGYISRSENYKLMGPFSEADTLKELTDELNTLVGAPLFGVCVNAGIANLLGQNIRALIIALDQSLSLVHATENDGHTDHRQMPYTFSSTRDVNSINWNSVIWGLHSIGYTSRIVFDVDGLFNIAPKALQPGMLGVLKSIEEEWEHYLHYHDFLDQGKKIILFGAGKMMLNYMLSWGEDFAPHFVGDNNSANWGKTIEGIEIRNPQTILDIPEEERLVLICNMHYDEIEKQLREMGIREFECYYDHYFKCLP